jgi:hypothetical protein
MFVVRQTSPLDANAGLQQNISIDASRNLIAAEQNEERLTRLGFSSPLTILFWLAVAWLAWKTLKG